MMNLAKKPKSKATIVLLTSKVNKTKARLTKERPKTIVLAFYALSLLTCVESAFSRDHGVTQPKSRLTKTESLQIYFQDNYLSIEAKQVLWQTLLTELKEKTQIQIKSAKPKEATVTVSIPAMPVNRAVQQLFNRHFDYVLLFNDAKAVIATPKTIWLLNNVKNTESVTSPDFENEQAAEITPKTGIKTMPIALKAGQQTAQELLRKAKKEADIERKIQALANLSGLGQTDKMAETLALENALDDKDAQVREYAVQALASRKNPETSVYLRQALDDPDAGVRMRALESITPEGEGLALLQEALTNPDELVQKMAEERLSQVEQ